MFELPKFGQGVCLERLETLLTQLSIDRQRLAARSVVVCGSNGKGSCAATIESIARAAGYKTGLFTSPHLLHFSERFQVNRQPIHAAELNDNIAKVTAAIALCGANAQAFGAFEAQFALACLYFQNEHCDFMIFEAGIGGRYDPVRLVRSPWVAVTSLDLEHTELLGHSLELIGYDKSDACPPLGTVFYGASCEPFLEKFKHYNELRLVKSQLVLRHPLAHHQALIGEFQKDNASVAIALTSACIQSLGEALKETELVRGLQTVRWDGRMQTISHQPLVVVDVGHTPDGIRAALQALKQHYPDRRWICVVGVSRDKDANGILKLLVPVFDHFICTQAYYKGALAQVIADQLLALSPEAIHPVRCDVANTVIQAVEQGRVYVGKNSTVGLFVAGGLFLSTEFTEAWAGRDPTQLAFF